MLQMCPITKLYAKQPSLMFAKVATSLRASRNWSDNQIWPLGHTLDTAAITVSA